MSSACAFPCICKAPTIKTWPFQNLLSPSQPCRSARQRSLRTCFRAPATHGASNEARAQPAAPAPLVKFAAISQTQLGSPQLAHPAGAVHGCFSISAGSWCPKMLCASSGAPTVAPTAIRGHQGRQVGPLIVPADRPGSQLLPGCCFQSTAGRRGLRQPTQLLQRRHGLVAPEHGQAGAAERHEHDADGRGHSHQRVSKVRLRQQEAQRRALHACAPSTRCLSKGEDEVRLRAGSPAGSPGPRSACLA